MNIDTYLSKQLQSGEELVRVVRRHRATMGPTVGLGGVLIILDFFLIAWWFQHRAWGGFGFALVIVLAVWLIIRGVYIWSHNVLAVTTRRVIDVDQRGVFERHVSEASLEAIQDVRYSIRGFWPTMLRFGTLIIQTAAKDTNLEMQAVPRPVDLQQLIFDVQRQSGTSHRERMSPEQAAAMVQRLRSAIGPDGVRRMLETDDDHG